MTERERDYSWEALVDVTGADPKNLTKDERGRINAALKQLRELELGDDYLLAAQIHEKARAWTTVYPEISLTPQALTGQWSSIEEKAVSTRRAQIRPINAPPAPESFECQTCHGDRMVLFGVRPSEKNPTSGYDEMAPCPECNAGVDAAFWRADGSRFRPPDAAAVRERMGA